MRDIARAAALRSTMNTAGWKLIEATAGELLKARGNDVILSDDESQIVSLQRRAKGATDFWNELQRTIQAAVDIQQEPNEY